MGVTELLVGETIKERLERNRTGLLWPVAQKIMNFWPLPNNPNVNRATPWVNNYVQGSKWPTRNNVWITKFDHKLSDKHQLFVRTNTGTGFFNFNYDFPGLATPGRNVVHRPNKGIAVDDTYLISPRTVLDTRTSPAARLRLSVRHSTNTATPFGP